ncbi:hypothetical protein [Rubritalea squalenifaciens]|uniref:hypothetical protein n=1 Tax=Rubritalea squalenifaciens TaxID=407226 RepID=UPI0011606863|nr:hypothetical protein [Rubritalea squalenifaciens]
MYRDTSVEASEQQAEPAAEEAPAEQTPADEAEEQPEVQLGEEPKEALMGERLKELRQRARKFQYGAEVVDEVLDCIQQGRTLSPQEAIDLGVTLSWVERHSPELSDEIVLGLRKMNLTFPEGEEPELSGFDKVPEGIWADLVPRVRRKAINEDLVDELLSRIPEDGKLEKGDVGQLGMMIYEFREYSPVLAEKLVKGLDLSRDHFPDRFKMTLIATLRDPVEQFERGLDSGVSQSYMSGVMAEAMAEMDIANFLYVLERLKDLQDRRPEFHLQVVFKMFRSEGISVDSLGTAIDLLHEVHPEMQRYAKTGLRSRVENLHEQGQLDDSQLDFYLDMLGRVPPGLPYQE